MMMYSDSKQAAMQMKEATECQKKTGAGQTSHKLAVKHFKATIKR